MRISDWSSDVCSSDLQEGHGLLDLPRGNGFHVLPEIIIKFGLIRLVSESRYHARAIIKHEEDRGAFRAEYKIASDLVRGRDVKVSRREPSVVVHHVA